MHPVALLHQHLQKAVPSTHRTRLKALMAAVGSVLCGAQVSITSLGRNLSNVAFIKHKIKRMDRLIGNTRLYQERWSFYAALTQWLVRGLPHPLILIDWSPLSDDQEFHVLRASLPVKVQYAICNMRSGLAICHELRDQCYDDNSSDDVAVAVAVKLITMLGRNTCSVSLDLRIAVAMIAV